MYVIFGYLLPRNTWVAAFAACAALVLISQAAVGQIISPQRQTVWQGNVGVPAGIPIRAVYAYLSTGASGATIQAALNACPSNQVVQLGAGVYSIRNTLSLKSGVTLRGYGMGSTVLVCPLASPVIAIKGNYVYDWSSPVPSNHVSWVGGYTQGANAITVSTTNLAGTAAAVPLGRLIFMDQLNDTNTSANGAEGVNPGAYTSIANPGTGLDRYQNQMARVTGTNGNKITISPGVFMANFNATNLPQIWWESANPIEYAGVEDMSIAVTNANSYAVSIENAWGCWAKNVEATQCRRGFSTSMAVRCEIRHCTVGPASGSGDDYPFGLFCANACLFEDNIVHDDNNGFVLMTCSGNAFAYNYVTNTLSTAGWMHSSVSFHGGHPSMNLLEGNVFTQVSIDSTWGSSIMQTLLRNRLTGIDEGSTLYNNVEAVEIGATNRFMNIVGNVLGTAGRNTWYKDYGQSGPFHNNVGDVFLIGLLSAANATLGYDPVAYSSLVLAMNWDSATATNGGIVTGGYTSADVPNSYFLSSKPSYFGILKWPPVSPTNVSYSTSRTNIPAGYRFVYGVDPPQVSLKPPLSLRFASQ
jgi:hypothetical protein